MDKNTSDIWLVGTGLMGIEYAKVLNSINVSFMPIGRGSVSADNFEIETGIKPAIGGLDDFISRSPEVPDAAIIAVGVEGLTAATICLLNYGVKNILIEKPGVGYASEIDIILSLSRKKNANVFIAYNRRFYSSVNRAQEIINLDGGVTSFNFEFTEWSHLICGLQKTKVEHETWFLCNSTHVIDTAFFIGGKPKEIHSFYKGGLSWHPSSSIFCGAGISQKEALFSYQANWEAPGRWVIEVCTRKHRLIFKPMEKLKIQHIGSIIVDDVIIDDKLDIDFKPGLFLQTKSFLEHDFSKLCTVQEQHELIHNVYNLMSGY
jgi:predicted dehydrogenase